MQTQFISEEVKVTISPFLLYDTSLRERLRSSKSFQVSTQYSAIVFPAVPGFCKRSGKETLNQ